MNTPQPILPGVPVPFPCWLLTRIGKPHWRYATALRTSEDSHYLLAPATADPATFPKAETLPVNSDETSEHPRGASVAPTEERAVFAHDVITNCIVSPTVAAKFRQEGTRHELRDPETGIVVVVYTKANGHILVDEMRPPSAGTEQKERGEASLVKQLSYAVQTAFASCCPDSTAYEAGLRELEKHFAAILNKANAHTVGTTTPRTDAHRNSIHTSDVTRNPFEVINGYTAFAKLLEGELNATSRALSESQCNLHRMWSPRAELHACQAQNADLTARLALAEKRLNTVLTGNEEGGVPWLNGRIGELTLALLQAEKRLGEAQEALAESQQFFAGSQNLLEIADREAARLIEQRDDLRAQLATSQARLVEVEKERDAARAHAKQSQ